MLRVARDVGRETQTFGGASQTLAKQGPNAASLSASAKQNPKVTMFRYRGVQVACFEFGPVTARLWPGRVAQQLAVVLKQLTESLYVGSSFTRGSVS